MPPGHGYCLRLCNAFYILYLLQRSFTPVRGIERILPRHATFNSSGWDLEIQ